MPRGSWKLGKIIQLIPSKDNEIRAAKVQLATKKILTRAMNHLYPLECASSSEPRSELKDVQKVLPREISRSLKRPNRRAADEAREKIRRMISEET